MKLNFSPVAGLNYKFCNIEYLFSKDLSNEGQDSDGSRGFAAATVEKLGKGDDRSTSSGEMEQFFDDKIGSGLNLESVDSQNSNVNSAKSMTLGAKDPVK